MGKASFETYAELPLPDQKLYTPIGDLYGDGGADLVIGNDVYSGPLDEVPEAITIGSAGQLFGCAAGDLDGDGHVELIVADAYARLFVLDPGRGPLDVATAQTTVDFSAVPWMYAYPTVMDGNDDGEDDLVVLAVSGDRDEDEVAVFDHLSAGTMTDEDAKATVTGEASNALYGDWDGDGRPDLVIRTDPGTWIEPDARGTLSLTDGIPIGVGEEPYGGGTVLDAHDANGDGYRDLLVTQPNGVNHVWRFDGPFVEPRATEDADVTFLPPDGQTLSGYGAVADADGDGFDEVYLGLNTGVWVAPESQGGRVAEGYLLHGDITTPIVTNAGDVDGEPGDEILVHGDRYDDELLLLTLSSN